MNVNAVKNIETWIRASGTGSVMPRNRPSGDPFAVRAASSSGLIRISPNAKNKSPVTIETVSTCTICESASTKPTLSRSDRDRSTRRGRSGMVSNGVPRSAAASCSALASGSRIGRTPAIMVDSRNDTAIVIRNTRANHSRGRWTVAAMVHTGPLKKTSTVNNITGSARSNRLPTEARLPSIMRTAQPRMAPPPLAVPRRISATMTASATRSAHTRGLGPP